MAPTFRQLRYFTVLADELHFGRAAEKLNISQPPLSIGIRQLEEDLQVQLLVRTSRQVMLTRAGEAFATQARMLLGQLAEAEALTKKIAASPGGVLRMGLVPSMIFRGLRDILEEFRDRHAGYTVEIREMNSLNQIEAIFDRKIDIGFIHGLPLPDGIDSLLLVNEPFICCLPVGHPLANSKRVSIASLSHEPLIIFSRPLAPHYHDHILDLFRVAGIEPRIQHTMNHWLTIVALVANGFGIALVPRSLSQSGISGAVFLPLEEGFAVHEARAIWNADVVNDGRDWLVQCIRDLFPASPIRSG